MVIIAKPILKKFIKKNPGSENAIWDWYLKTKMNSWKSFAELRLTFGAADYVGDDLIVFDIGGNKYRLIARIFFSTRTVYIGFIGTHKEYDKFNIATL